MGSSQSDIYSDAASFGQFYASLALFIAFIVALIMLVISISKLRNNNKHIDAVIATVTNFSCENYTINNRTNCYTTIEYNYKEKPYKVSNFPYNSYNYQNLNGLKITVYINPDNPTDVSLISKESERNMAFLLLGFAVLIILIALFRWWLTRRSKFFAAAEGTGAGISLFRNVI